VPSATAAGLVPQLVTLPNVPDLFTTQRTAATACTLPDGTDVSYFHCYTPQQIRSAYQVNRVLLKDGTPDYGKGQTIVLVDAYGSPTAAQDLTHFHNTFFPSLPPPDFQQIFPQGNPQYHNTSHGSGLAGSNGAAGWSGEATLDTEWAYSIAPEAHIILMAVPPSETEGVQGFPNLFKAISAEISATPRGTVFSMSFAATEQTFGGAAAAQVAGFDAVFQKGLARNDNFFAAAGDTGTSNSSKVHEESVPYPYPTVSWPASSPYVVAVGGTQLQYGWTWDPSSDTAFTPSSNNTVQFNPNYWASTSGGDTQAVWNESWGPVATGGGASVIYQRPSWQTSVASQFGNHRLVPDTSWNAAVNGGVDVYITAYPEYNCGNSTGCWTIYGGTSAATPQTAALVALTNAARYSKGKGPIGFLDPLLYQMGSTLYTGSSPAYQDIVPQQYGSAAATFAGSEVDVQGQVLKSVGYLEDNQLWDVSTPGYATTTGYDPTTGWGAPIAPGFVAALGG
jgi:subtilase family serine protease